MKMTKHGMCYKTYVFRGLRNKIHSSQKWDSLLCAITLPIQIMKRKLLIRIYQKLFSSSFAISLL